MQHNQSTFKKLYLTFFIGILVLMNVVLILIGDKTFPKVAQVNFGTQEVSLSRNVLNLPLFSASQRQILITFNRKMDRRSVEENFVITPKVMGKFSWNGHNMAFSPDEALPYGSKYQIKISKAAKDEDGKNMDEDFLLNFKTDTLSFAYISTDASEQDKLIVSDLGGEKKESLTDGKVKIDSYKITPDGQQIYFLGATEKFFKDDRLELFVLNIKDKKITQLTQDKNYLNKKFTLSPDGSKLALSRIQVDPSGTLLTRNEIWLGSVTDYKFTKFLDGRAQGMDFYFTPDSASLLYRNGDGNFELAALDAKPDQSAFIGEYQYAYGFHPFKPIISFTKYDETDVFSLKNNLILYYGDGNKDTVKLEDGITRDNFFTPNGKKMIILFSAQSEEFDDKESSYPVRIFHLYLYDLENKALQKLIDDGDYSEEGAAVSPDSKFMIFERYSTADAAAVIDPAYRDVASSLGGLVNGGEIWIMNLGDLSLKKLAFKGKKLSFFP